VLLGRTAQPVVQLPDAFVVGVSEGVVGVSVGDEGSVGGRVADAELRGAVGVDEIWFAVVSAACGSHRKPLLFSQRMVLPSPAKPVVPLSDARQYSPGS
jgi:hypothetical protein